MSRPEDFYVAWEYLSTHPAFFAHEGDDWGFDGHLDILVMRDDETGEVRIELEHGPWAPPTPDTPGISHGSPSHDLRLDSAAPTFEAAVMQMAEKVRRYYPDTTLPVGAYFDY